MTREEFIAFQRSLPTTDEQKDCCMVDVTYQCSAGCRYCYAPKGEHRNLLDIITEIENVPQSRILLTGGEPLEYPDLDDVLEICRVMGKKPALLTNGAYLTCQKMEELLKHGLDMIDGYPQVALSLQLPGYNNTFERAYENAQNILVDNIAFTVDSPVQIESVKYYARKLRGLYRSVCIRTAWHPYQKPKMDAYDVVSVLKGDLLALPTPFAERGASVLWDSIHFKVISWPNREEYDPALYAGKGVWYKGANVVTTLLSDAP